METTGRVLSQGIVVVKVDDIGRYATTTTTKVYKSSIDVQTIPLTDTNLLTENLTSIDVFLKESFVRYFQDKNYIILLQ